MNWRKLLAVLVVASPVLAFGAWVFYQTYLQHGLFGIITAVLAGLAVAAVCAIWFTALSYLLGAHR